MKRAFALLEVLVLLGIVVILALIILPVFTKNNPPPRRSQCQSQLTQIGLGLQQYVQDYDEYLPLVRPGPANAGWVECLDPYVKSSRIYQCPSASRRATIWDSEATLQTDYFMNRRLSGLEMRTVVIPSSTVVLGEGDGGMDPKAPHYSLASIPPEWPVDPGSPRNRHLEGCNFGFVDGHVKWIPTKVTVGTANPKWVQYTFAPR